MNITLIHLVKRTNHKSAAKGICMARATNKGPSTRIKSKSSVSIGKLRSCRLSKISTQCIKLFYKTMPFSLQIQFKENTNIIEIQVLHYLVARTGMNDIDEICFSWLTQRFRNHVAFCTSVTCYHCNILSAMGKVGATSTGT